MYKNYVDRSSIASEFVSSPIYHLLFEEVLNLNFIRISYHFLFLRTSLNLHQIKAPSSRIAKPFYSLNLQPSPNTTHSTLYISRNVYYNHLLPIFPQNRRPLRWDAWHRSLHPQALPCRGPHSFRTRTHTQQNLLPYLPVSGYPPHHPRRHLLSPIREIHTRYERRQDRRCGRK